MNFKEIIKKIAQASKEVPMIPLVPELQEKSENASKQAPNQTHSNSGQKPFSPVKSSAIQEMQLAIIAVGDAASKIDLSSKTDVPAKATELGESNYSFEKDQSNSLSTFVTNNYIAPKNDSGDGVSQKSLSDIINTIKTVGTPGLKGGSATADGVWKGLTQEALKNISTLVAGFLHFTLSMGIKTTSYAWKDIETFNGLIATGYPKFSTPAANLAPRITPHLNAMKNFLLSLNQEIAKSPTLKNQMSGRKSLSKYKQAPSKNEVPEGFDKVNINLPNFKLKKQLQLTDLQDVAHFKAWLGENGVENSDASTKQILAQIKGQL